MCGRFSLHTAGTEVARQFQLAEVPDLPPRYNIAPTQEIATMHQQGSERALVWLRWGLVPAWARDSGIGAKMINARGETVAEKPAFRAAFKQRRCLVLADGFYEWQATGKGRHKQPVYFHLQDGKPFALAGLWERWQNADTVLTTCTIITTAANELLRPIHERMPVIVPPEAYSQWLDPAVTQREPLEALLTPFPADAMTGYPVSRTVNNVRNDSPACIAPAEG